MSSKMPRLTRRLSLDWSIGTMILMKTGLMLRSLQRGLRHKANLPHPSPLGGMVPLLKAVLIFLPKPVPNLCIYTTIANIACSTGACRIPDMVDWAVENSVPAVALTDHGNMFGAWEFYNKATEAGVKPVIGCEVYVAPDSRKTREQSQDGPYHLTLLAEDATGYQNLSELVSLGYTEGFNRKPRIDMEILREHREGIIALTGCIQGQVPATPLRKSA